MSDKERIAVLEEALAGIGRAMRLGANTDVQAWADLAEAMRHTALAALTPQEEQSDDLD